MAPVQPTANAVPLLLPRWVDSIRITATSGSGLIAIPTAEASI